MSYNHKMEILILERPEEGSRERGDTPEHPTNIFKPEKR